MSNHPYDITAHMVPTADSYMIHVLRTQVRRDLPVAKCKRELVSVRVGSATPHSSIRTTLILVTP